MPSGEVDLLFQRATTRDLQSRSRKFQEAQQLSDGADDAAEAIAQMLTEGHGREGRDDEEDSSDYSSSDDETTLPQVTTLESVLAMIPFTPDWWEARAVRSPRFEV